MPTSSPNILIVENCSNDQHLVARLFKSSFCCSISFTHSFKEAEQKILNGKFDLISLDGMLDPEPGYFLIPIIQQNQDMSKCKIIMFSGDESSLQAGLALGAHMGYNKDCLTQKLKLNDKLELIPITNFT